MTVSLNGTSGITFSDASAQNTAATGFGFKNRIINGAAAIDQRNGGVAQTAVSSGAYICDRFSFGVSQNGKWALQQVAISDLPGFTSAAYATISTTYTTGSTDYALIDHKIEGFNVADLAWGTANAKTITLSFWVKTSTTGIYGVTLMNSTPNRAYTTSYTVSASGTWTQISVTIPGDTTGTWLTNNGIGLWLRFSLGCGSTYAAGTLNAWGSTVAYQPSGGAIISGNTGGYFEITGVQLEKSPTATSFDYRPYGTELSLCQRYYENSNGAGGVQASTDAYVVTTSAASSGLYPTYVFKVGKRISPTMTLTYAGGSGATFVIANGSFYQNTNHSVPSTFGWTATAEL